MDSSSDNYESDDFIVSDSEDDFMMEEENSPVKKPAAPKNSKPTTKKKPTTKAKTSALSTKTTTGEKKPASKTKTVEEIYQKKSQLEHILLRPDTYVGSIEEVSQNMWVYDDTSSEIVQKKISFVPGLYKIFDEIIVNAYDNKQRDDSGMDMLKVTIDENEISVWNNGKGIPIVLHKEHNIYVPELIFGHLLTGSNFNDKQKKTTGGRNGYGAKLTNIFSKKFVVETSDGKQTYKQVFQNNMSQLGEPLITKNKSTNKKSYTCVSFQPDLSRFGMTHLDEDIISLFKKRVYDIAGMTTDKKFGVYLNGEKLPIKSFAQYVQLYSSAHKNEVIFDRVEERWQVGVGLSEDGFQQVSFVNGISTTKGGQHVSYIADQVATKLSALVKKKNKGEQVKPAYIKNHMTVYVSALIENPAFDSQTKETLTTRVNAFGSTFTLSDKFLKQVEKTGIVDRILSFAKFKQTAELRRKAGTTSKRNTKLTGIPKLDDANFAGSSGARGSQKCTLIVTEGDSAKALAVSGLGVIGRDYYGVFPLRGKLLNVREASHSQILKNEEVQNLVKILGLKFGEKYENGNRRGLRYGKLMIMTDQDHDGSHIKGLVINFIHHFWPSLLEGDEPFLQEFITPIVKATHKNKTHVFYTLPQYENWLEQQPQSKKWQIKYYKGLGTSTSKEAKEYFGDLGTHQVDFIYENDGDGDAIDMAFSKKRVEDRKNWLRSYEMGTHVDYDVASMDYQTFVNKELILFSMADNSRSIPHLIDGLKPSQRKILFSCFKRKLVKQEIKVAQLAGYVSEHSAYHHGEAALNGAIVGMAQDFVGSNNCNLLVPSGQFGTRLLGGKDAASPRYIFTKLSPITSLLFYPHIDPIEHQLEDGMTIEPLFYVPILPMVLVNGNDGIGTGWSSAVPNYNPRDLIKQLQRMISDGSGECDALTPWYRGFVGTIVAKSSHQFLVRGCYEVVDDVTLHITELPIRSWTQQYKVFLESLLESGVLKDFKENHTDTTVSFTCEFADADTLRSYEKDQSIWKKMKLESSISTSNMHLFNHRNQIVKYDTPQEIVQEFYHIRLAKYVERKECLLEKLEQLLLLMRNKVRFIEAVIEEEVEIRKKPKQHIVKQLQELKFHPIYKQKQQVQDHEEVQEEYNDSSPEHGGFDYLLSMALWSLTYERVEKIKSELDEKEAEKRELENTTPETMWLNDLEALAKNLDESEKQYEIVASTRTKKTATTSRKKASKKPSSPIVSKKKNVNKVKVVEPHVKKETIKKAKSVKKKPGVSKKVIISSEEEEEEEEEAILSLAERLSKRMEVTPKKETKKFSFQTINENKKFEFESYDQENIPPTKKSTLKRSKEKTPKKTKLGKNNVVIVETPPKASPENKKRRVNKKKTIAISSSSDEQEVQISAARSTSRRTAAKKPIVYIDSDDSEVEDEGDSEDDVYEADSLYI